MWYVAGEEAGARPLSSSAPAPVRMKITETLVAEHRIFLRVFDQIDRLLPRMRTVSEVRRMASLVEELLMDHGATETELAYPALDHMLQDKGRLERLNQEHQEIDAGLREVQAATTLGEARRRLETALLMSRNHFRFEERFVFHLFEELLQQGTLAELGADWLRRIEGSRRPG